jgi:FKBP-type peptidyl-prolyl cis-trans isomerase
MMKRLVVSLAVPMCVVAALLLIDAAPVVAQNAKPAQTSARRLPPPAPAGIATVPADVEKSDSGLAWQVLTPGTGTAYPLSTDVVTVQYNAWRSDGGFVDSTVFRGKPGRFVLGSIETPKGLHEAISLMTVGEKARFWMPEDLAYIPNKPKMMCVWDIELVSIEHGVPATPPDVAAPPADATRTASGLAYKVLEPGRGTVHPQATDTVTVHYSGWTADGKMFDSSIVRNQGPLSRPLNTLIAGWVEGVQLMVEGAKYRFWIPANLAYGEKPGNGRPGGMLVFDIDLIKIGQ